MAAADVAAPNLDDPLSSEFDVLVVGTGLIEIIYVQLDLSVQ